MVQRRKGTGWARLRLRVLLGVLVAALLGVGWLALTAKAGAVRATPADIQVLASAKGNKNWRNRALSDFQLKLRLSPEELARLFPPTPPPTRKPVNSGLSGKKRADLLKFFDDNERYDFSDQRAELMQRDPDAELERETYIRLKQALETAPLMPGAYPWRLDPRAPIPELDPSRSELAAFYDLWPDNFTSETSGPEPVARVIAVTYGEGCCTFAKKKFCETAADAGKIDECHAYDESMLDEKFYKEHKNIFHEDQGAGLWLWKPWLIRKTLLEAGRNDVVIYADAGSHFVGPPDPLIDHMHKHWEDSKGVLMFGLDFPQREWCKRDAFILQNCDTKECHDAMQVNAFMMMFRKTRHAFEVLDNWLRESCDIRVLGNSPSQLGYALKGYQRHRHDQAVITNIMTREGWWRDTTNGPLIDLMLEHTRYKY